jgi:hypothetical protein
MQRNNQVKTIEAEIAAQTIDILVYNQTPHNVLSK